MNYECSFRGVLLWISSSWSSSWSGLSISTQPFVFSQNDNAVHILQSNNILGIPPANPLVMRLPPSSVRRTSWAGLSCSWPPRSPSQPSVNDVRQELRLRKFRKACCFFISSSSSSSTWNERQHRINDNNRRVFFWNSVRPALFSGLEFFDSIKPIRSFKGRGARHPLWGLWILFELLSNHLLALNSIPLLRRRSTTLFLPSRFHLKSPRLNTLLIYTCKAVYG